MFIVSRGGRVITKIFRGFSAHIPSIWVMRCTKPGVNCSRHAFSEFASFAKTRGEGRKGRVTSRRSARYQRVLSARSSLPASFTPTSRNDTLRFASFAVTNLARGLSPPVDAMPGVPKKKDRLAAVSPKSDVVFIQAAAIAAEPFFVPREAKKPRAMKPAISIVHVEGSGVNSTLRAVGPA